MTAEAPAPDRGPTGEAFRARPYAVSRSAAVSRGSVNKGDSVELLRMTDTTLVDRMWNRGQFSNRQHRAAKTLLTIWSDAGLNPRVVASLPVVQDVVWEREEAGERDGPGPAPLKDGETWRDRYRRIMRSLGSPVAGYLDGLMLDLHPGMNGMDGVQRALDWLADGWGFEKEG